MKVMKRICLFALICIVACILIGAVFLFTQIMYVNNNPLNIEENAKALHATYIYDSEGNLIQKLGDNKAKSSYSDEIPSSIKNAIISIEDKRFYEHDGVDVKRTASAILNYVLKFGDTEYGGSTITQQLVKNVSGENKKTITRKVREWLYALDIEKKHDKDYIITQYLNTIYFGHGIYGINDASSYYFNKNMNELNINEIAYLVGIVQRPETYIRNEEKANKRKNTVLYCMYKQGYITEEEYTSNKEADISISEKIKTKEIQSYFVDSVIEKFGEVLSGKYNISQDNAIAKIYQGGYKIYTTLNSSLQADVDKLYNAITNIQSAIVIMTNDGKVVAIRGGTGSKQADRELNRALYSRRQPGSAFKPLVAYAPALEEKVITSSSIICDENVTYGNWSPQNWYSGYRGNISVRKALEISCNTAAVQLLNSVGINKSKEYLSKMNIKLDDADMNLSIALGGLTYGVTPIEMASGYQTLANNGVYCEPIFFEKVIDNTGKEIYDYKKEQEKRRVFSEETSKDITDLLTTVVTGSEGTAKSFKLANCEVAAKTGTTSDVKDKWLCGYTPKYTVATWYGYDKPKHISYSNSKIQKDTKALLDKLHTNIDEKSFNIIKKKVSLNICSKTGMLAGDFCADVVTKQYDEGYSVKQCDSCEDVCQTNEYIEGEVLEDNSEINENFEEEIVFEKEVLGEESNTQQQEDNTVNPPSRETDISVN
ncbi:MAG: penicillin-binding protein [Clostridiales bacterium]|nr:penicillin-binding protein [Clostridiales bacterium]